MTEQRTKTATGAPRLPATASAANGPDAAAWHALDPDAALAQLAATRHGLSTDEAADRLARYGRNELPRPRRPGMLFFYLRQFRNPLVYLLLAAAGVSLGLGDIPDAVFIFVVLQINAAIGTVQEWRAEKSAVALDQLIRQTAIVRRSGEWLSLPASVLVPGDIIRLESGGRVVADGRLIAVRELLLDESLLTGESTPVDKNMDPVGPDAALGDRRSMLFAGTAILAGRARMLVTATGSRTEIGRIATQLAGGDVTVPPLMRRLARFNRAIGIATMATIAILAAVQYLQGLDLATVFLVGVALAVAAIPEGLPVAITVALAIATNRMQARNVIVRALPAIEGLGSCTLIASDKTGTLTRNQLTVRRVRLPEGGPDIEIEGHGYEPEGAIAAGGRPLEGQASVAFRRLVECGATANEATIRHEGEGLAHIGDTVDVAFLVLAAKAGVKGRGSTDYAPSIGFVPYEPSRRFGAAFTADADEAGRAVAHVKGAAETVLPMCRDVDVDAALGDANRLAADGYRVIALACGPVARAAGERGDPACLAELKFLGLVGIIDPVRPEVPTAVARCREAGIGVVMITGDHPATALAIARELDIAGSPNQVVTGTQLTSLSDESDAFDSAVRHARVFARVEPAQKLDIVEALQRDGNIVAVTGDGVNDAPALFAADIGVAMGRGGTEVARDAADLILADDNFASIVGGVEEGRVAYDNVRRLIWLLITTGFAEIVLFLLAILFGAPIPLLAVQLLWLNLVTNGIQDVALAFERGEPNTLTRPPRPPRQPLFDRRMVTAILTTGAFMGGMAFVFYDWCLSTGMAEADARNLLLLLMVIFENMQALNARSERRSVLQVPFGANPFLIISIVGAHAVHIAAMHIPGIDTLLGIEPIGLLDWLMVLGVGLSLIVVVEIYKRTVSVWFDTHPAALARVPLER